MNIEVRFYQEGDLNDVNQILKEAFSCEKSNFVNDNIFEIVATVEDKVVGYLMLTKVWNPILQKYYCLVDYVCVSSSYRDGGVGKKLLDFAYQVAKGESAIYLQLTCSRFRIAAHHLYEKCNFIKRDSDIYRKEIL